MERTGYKVVSVFGGKFFSAISYTGRIRYKANVYVEPQEGFGPLAVFDTIFNATEFRDCCRGGRVIRKCRYVPSRARSLWQKGGWRLMALPPGTRLAQKVKLLRGKVRP